MLADDDNRIGPSRCSTRANVDLSIVSGPSSGCICFGAERRDSGHRRVPAPPDRMTGIVAAIDS